jgi:tetratricopeptide (TPR) repeat protein
MLENPEYSNIARNLGASLIGSHDADGLSRLVEIWERTNGETGWSLFLRGYLSVINGEVDKAVASFDRSLILSPRWETAYNLGILAENQGRYEQAGMYLRKAEAILANTGYDNGVTKALLWAATAKIHYELGDFKAAAREAAYAMDLDPGCDEAAIILALLEQKGD